MGAEISLVESIRRLHSLVSKGDDLVRYRLPDGERKSICISSVAKLVAHAAALARIENDIDLVIT
jgi:hypothetical protein